MNDTLLQSITSGCVPCRRCQTPIFPGQSIERSDLSGAARPQHDNPHDCIDGLLRVVHGTPPWQGLEDTIMRGLSVSPLTNYDCVTGTMTPKTRT